jgi:hypothetical protein
LLKGVVLLAFSTTEDERSAAIKAFTNNIYNWPDKGHPLVAHRTTALGALAAASDFAAALAGGDKDTYMRDMSNVFGNDGDGIKWFGPLPIGRTERGQYTVEGTLSNDGFDTTFADPNPQVKNSDQPLHIWFYVQVAYYRGAGWSHIGNTFHEQPWDGPGASQQDWNAGWEASFIGQDIAWERLSIYGVGDRLLWRFSTPYGVNR